MRELNSNFMVLLEQGLLGNARLPGSTNLIQIVLGPRQVGKTMAVQQIAKTWPGPVVFASADLPYAPQRKWIRAQWQKARSYKRRTSAYIKGRSHLRCATSIYQRADQPRSFR